jgi:hypothetical protein
MNRIIENVTESENRAILPTSGDVLLRFIIIVIVIIINL